jgi:hypothetical protein
MYPQVLQRYATEYILTTDPAPSIFGRIVRRIRLFLGMPVKVTLRSAKNPNYRRFSIERDPTLKVNQWRMDDGTVGTWPDSFCRMPS